MTFRIRYRPVGRHIECFLFSAQAPDRTFAACGSFRVRSEELADLEAAMPGIAFIHEPFSETDPPPDIAKSEP